MRAWSSGISEIELESRTVSVRNALLSRGATGPTRSGSVPWIVCVFLFLLASSVGGATSRPAPAPPNPLILEAQKMVRQGRIRDIAAKVEPKLLIQFDGIAPIDPEEVTRLATLREFSRYFSRVKEPDKRAIDTLEWLIGQPRLAPALMMTISAFDPPERVLEIVRVLREDHEDKLDEFANLTAATAVVWDAPERFGPQEDVKLDPNEVSRVFEFFVTSADRLTYDPRRMPAELLVFVVDMDLSNEELRWLAVQTGHRVNVPTAWAMVPHSDYVGYAHNSREPGDPQAFILPNILKRGGGADVAAHVASQAARSAGIPAVTVRAADAADGAVPWWIGFLQGGAAPAWDFWSARYREHSGWRAQIVDPQTYEISGESDVAMLAGLLNTPNKDRLASMAMVKSIDLLPAKQRASLLRKALDLSPANRAGWYALADLVAEQKPDDAAMTPVEEVMGKYVSRRWPEFATVLRLRMLKGRGTLEYDKGAKKAIDAVRDRPELVAMIRLTIVDRLRDEKRYPEAAAMLKDILRSHVCSPAVAVSVMMRLDEVLHKQDDLPQLAAIYREVFHALVHPGSTKLGRTTVYYRIGARYAALLDEMKQPAEAEQVRLRMENTAVPE
jgi:hypothetical protein